MAGWLPWLAGLGTVMLVAGWLAVLWWRRRAPAPRADRTGPSSRRRPTPATRRTGPTTRPAQPQVGEIWWADVPYEDGSGSKVRPCLVLRVRRRGADVLKITSQDKRDRRDHVRLPTRHWDPRADRDSFLDVVNLIRVPPAAFVRRAGACDPTVWRGVRRLHGVRAGDSTARARRRVRSG